MDLQSAEAEPRLQGAVRAVQRGAAVDDLTVDLVTKGPYPLVLNLATYIFPMDREFYTGTDERGRPKDGSSSTARPSPRAMPAAPVRSSSPSASRGCGSKLKRFADYWDKASPGNVDEIVFTPIKEPATRVAALLAGDVDFIAPVPPTDLGRHQEAILLHADHHAEHARRSPSS